MDDSQLKKEKELELLWLDLENRVKSHDFGLMMKTYWALFYTIWPEKRKNTKKTASEVVKDAKEMLSPDEINAKLNDIGKQFHIDPSEKTE